MANLILIQPSMQNQTMEALQHRSPIHQLQLPQCPNRFRSTRPHHQAKLLTRPIKRVSSIPLLPRRAGRSCWENESFLDASITSHVSALSRRNRESTVGGHSTCVHDLLVPRGRRRGIRSGAVVHSYGALIGMEIKPGEAVQREKRKKIHSSKLRATFAGRILKHKMTSNTSPASHSHRRISIHCRRTLGD